MTFLSGLREDSNGNPFDALGYLDNPFPTRGAVWPEFFVPRPELEDLQSSLVRFLRGRGPGKVWAVAGESGFGKSNLLRHVEWSLANEDQAGRLSLVAYRYVASQQVSPRLLADEIVRAIGDERFTQLLQQFTTVPEAVRGTDLHQFLRAVQQEQSDQDYVREAARFLSRWIGGHQTYAWERRGYAIASRERMLPAVAFPYLRALVEMMSKLGLLDRLVILLDEFEDIQAMRNAAQADYLFALKSLFNAFNWERLFVVIAGQENTFLVLGQRFPSLATRWTRVSLQPIQSSEAAVKLASVYRERKHRVWKEVNPTRRVDVLRPTDDDVEVTYARLVSNSRRVEVTARDLLDKLHNWIEDLVSD